jgi:hypothetical protein
MNTDYKLPEEYTQVGFHISRFGMQSLALKHKERTIFVFNSTADLKDDFVSPLCNYYAKRTSNSVKSEPALTTP